MHHYFVLVRGTRWAGTGSTFRAIPQPTGVAKSSDIIPVMTGKILNEQHLIACNQTPSSQWAAQPPPSIPSVDFVNPNAATAAPMPACELATSEMSYLQAPAAQADPPGGERRRLRLPETVALIAAEGTALRWDPGARWYEVLHGPLFEQRCAFPSRPASPPCAHPHCLAGSLAGAAAAPTPGIGTAVAQHLHGNRPLPRRRRP